MFWSGETLSIRLSRYRLIEPFDPDRVDCASYRLSIGDEIYVSPSEQAEDPNSVTVRKLDEGEAFTIPSGQFAFLITEEVISVPDDAVAFISIRAKTKFCGLVNISGFHIDPGYRGQLTFSVYNAGPVSVHLQRGNEIFLIWYANLDYKTAKKKDGKIHMGLDIGLVTSVSGELHSFDSLSDKIDTVQTSLTDQINKLKIMQSRLNVIGTILIAISSVFIANLFIG